MKLTFNKAMVSAIAAGQKTQTRRPMETQPPSGMIFTGYANGIASFKDRRTHATFAAQNPYTDVEHDLGNGLRLRVRWMTCERLGDITPHDCVKQGVPEDIPEEERIEHFRKLWQGVHPSGDWAWNDDLWVWVVAFEVEEQHETRIQAMVNAKRREQMKKFFDFAAGRGITLTMAGRPLTVLETDELIKQYLEPEN